MHLWNVSKNIFLLLEVTCVWVFFYFCKGKKLIQVLSIILVLPDMTALFCFEILNKYISSLCLFVSPSLPAIPSPLSLSTSLSFSFSLPLSVCVLEYYTISTLSYLIMTVTRSNSWELFNRKGSVTYENENILKVQRIHDESNCFNEQDPFVSLYKFSKVLDVYSHKYPHYCTRLSVCICLYMCEPWTFLLLCIFQTIFPVLSPCILKICICLLIHRNFLLVLYFAQKVCLNSSMNLKENLESFLQIFKFFINL